MKIASPTGNSAPARLSFGSPELGPPDLLACADTLDLLRRLPDGHVDLAYVDPPFGTDTRRTTSSGHAYEDRTPAGIAGYVDWLRPRLAELRRVLAPHGSLFVHLDYRAVHYVKVELDRLFGPLRFVNEIAWCYSVGGKGARAFGRKHDNILWYTRGPRYAFFPEAVRVPRKPGSHMKIEHDADGRPVQVKRDARTGKVYRYPVHAGKVPDDYWIDIETLNRGDRERTGWPTQKPERLLERIIRAASAPGSLVADVFCGSATTAVVAQRLGRRFIACDAAAAAVAIARRRLLEAGRMLALSGQQVRDIVVETSPALHVHQ